MTRTVEDRFTFTCLRVSHRGEICTALLSIGTRLVVVFIRQKCFLDAARD